MVLDPIPQSLPVHFFGSRPQPPTSRRETSQERHQKRDIRRETSVRKMFLQYKERDLCVELNAKGEKGNQKRHTLTHTHAHTYTHNRNTLMGHEATFWKRNSRKGPKWQQNDSSFWHISHTTTHSNTHTRKHTPHNHTLTHTRSTKTGQGGRLLFRRVIIIISTSNKKAGYYYYSSK